MDKISSDYSVKNQRKHSYVSTAVVGGAIGAAATGVDLYMTSKGVHNEISEEICCDLGSGLSWAKVFRENKEISKFARSKFGAMTLGVFTGALELVLLSVIVQGVKNIFKKKD